MLLLTRRVGERIIINDDIIVTVVETKGRHVKLGVDAPDDVKVHREEVVERIRRETGLKTVNAS